MKPWDKREAENEFAYALFRRWLILDPWKRTAPKFVKELADSTGDDSPALPVSRDVIQKYRRIHEWNERARAYDLHRIHLRETAITRRLTAQAVALETKRFRARNMAVDQAIDSLTAIRKTTTTAHDEKRLNGILDAARKALELVGLSGIDAEDQLRKLLAKTSSRGRKKRAEKDQGLRSLPAQSDGLQRGSPSPEDLLEETDPNLPGDSRSADPDDSGAGG